MAAAKKLVLTYVDSLRTDMLERAIAEERAPTFGALVEPGGNAFRAASAAQAGPGRTVLVWGPGSIGLLQVLIELHQIHVDLNPVKGPF